MPGLPWYWRRACAMNLPEVGRRCRMAMRKRRWRSLAGADTPIRPIPDAVPPAPPAPIDIPPDLRDSPDARALIAEADACLEHRWPFFGLQNDPEIPIQWQMDPLTGRHAPLDYAFDIDHRDASVLGDVKYTWEKNRHHHFTVLAAAFCLTEDERYAEETVDQLLSWIEENPFLKGVNWTHALELGIRLIAWTWCWRLLAGSTHYERAFGKESPFWTSVYQHQWVIENSYSHDSSANNHVIGEMAGQFLASLAWPVFRESSQWQRSAQDRLEEEARAQTWSSGVNREQAFDYHIFVVEFLLLAHLAAREKGMPFSDDFASVLRGMIEVVPQLADVHGNLPRYGDSDDGMALQLAPRNGSRTAWLLECGRCALNANVPCEPGPGLASSFLGYPKSNPWSPPVIAGPSAFEDAGLYLLASSRRTPDEILVLSDAGPWGYLSIAAHAHADALSFTLHVAGLPILVDPGTYTYYNDERWRLYFRSTAGHNTVGVDGQDQGLSGGLFLWRRHADTKVLEWAPEEDGAVLVAEHDGYTRLAGRPVHRRSLRLAGSHLDVEDELSGKGRHLLEWRFHFAPECNVDLDKARCTVQREHVRIDMALDAAIAWDLVRGAEDGGWYSPKFGVKQPSWMLRGRLTTELTVKKAIQIGIHT